MKQHNHPHNTFCVHFHKQNVIAGYGLVMDTVVPSLQPPGFARPPLVGMFRELSLVGEGIRYVARTPWDHATRASRRWARATQLAEPLSDPSALVLLIPGFMAGDTSLSPLARALRHEGFRTYRSHILANVACTRAAADHLEQRLESVVERRGERVHLVGHSLGGMLARSLAVRRPDLVTSIVTLASPVLAPGAHHLSLAASLDVLVRLSRVGVPGLMSADCVGGECARASLAEAQGSLAPEFGYTSIYSRRDAVVDWRACLDPAARAIEVTASHTGMAVDPRVRDHIVAALRADQCSKSTEA